MIYLANRRDNQRTEGETKVQVFSNLDQVTLTVNGKEVVGAYGVNKKHWVFGAVKLKEGVNKIIAKGNIGDKILTDEMEWILK